MVVRAGGSERRSAPTAGNVTGDADDRLEPVEAWSRAHGLGVDAGDRVLVVHEPTDAVVLDVERRVE